jgi:hypothetical protein
MGKKKNRRTHADIWWEDYCRVYKQMSADGKSTRAFNKWKAAFLRKKKLKDKTPEGHGTWDNYPKMTYAAFESSKKKLSK